jgi:hypothetical protein
METLHARTTLGPGNVDLNPSVVHYYVPSASLLIIDKILMLSIHLSRLVRIAYTLNTEFDTPFARAASCRTASDVQEMIASDY